jgi:hypothetical protein
MVKIKDIETLHVEISRLRSEIDSGEQRLREHVTAFRESMKPANLVSTGLNMIIAEPTAEHNKSFIRETIKTGLLLLMEKVLTKPGEKGEQRISGLVDMAFDKVKKIFERKRKKKKESSFYKFENEYDSESN